MRLDDLSERGANLRTDEDHGLMTQFDVVRGLKHASGSAATSTRPAARTSVTQAAFTPASYPLRASVALTLSAENLFDRRIEVSATPVITLNTPRTVRLGIRVEVGGYRLQARPPL